MCNILHISSNQLPSPVSEDDLGASNRMIQKPLIRVECLTVKEAVKNRRHSSAVLHRLLRQRYRVIIVRLRAIDRRDFERKAAKNGGIRPKNRIF
jgi:hypothetical protein